MQNLDQHYFYLIDNGRGDKKAKGKKAVYNITKI